MNNRKIETEIILKLREIESIYNKLITAKSETFVQYNKKIKLLQEEIREIKTRLIDDSSIIFIN
jgi:hypothetical protein